MNDVHFKSDKLDWETPPDLFDELNKEFEFALDACAHAYNTKCAHWIGPRKHHMEDLQDLMNKVELQFPDDGTKQGKENKKKWASMKADCYQRFCEREGIDALTIAWHLPMNRKSINVWCNPPYGRALPKWIAKAHQMRFAGVTTVLLIPARTDTSYFHKFIWNRKKHRPRTEVEVRFLKGRLTFVGAKNGAPFPSMVVVFNELYGG